MKTMKKVFALALALVLCLGLFQSVFAAGAKTITISEAGNYNAYKILNVTASKTTNGETTYAYTINETYRAVLETATGKTADAEIIAAIKADPRGVADKVYKAIKENGEITADATSEGTNTINIEEAGEGYYLISDEDNVNDADDSASLVILDTVAYDENTSVSVKKDQPKVDKTITGANNEDGTYKDVNVGDDVEFVLKSTVPDYTEEYTTYTYVLHDTMSEGLTFKNGAYEGESFVISPAELAPYVQTKVEGQNITITVNMKQAVADEVVAPKENVTFTYKATLNEKAKDATAEVNSVYLEYSNNPYDEESKGKTPEEKVYVFTFDTGVNKVNNAGDPLGNAEFELWTGDKTAEGSKQLKFKMGENGEYVVDPNGTITTITAGNVVIHGLEEGTYYLYETKAPAGYNQLTDPVIITITAEYAEDGTTATKTVTVSGGESTDGKAKVVNNTGTELPSTGGIGTTLFYVIGAALIIGAGVLLVTKKRIGNKD